MSYNVFSGVGVWAATSASVAVTSKVNFTATGIESTISMYAAGDSISNVTASSTEYKGDNAVQMHKIVLSDSNTTASALATEFAITLADGGDGIVEANSTFTYNFTITNDSTTIPLYYQVTLGSDATSNTTVTAATTATTAQVTNGTPATFTVTYTIVSDISSTISNVSIPSITIALQKTAFSTT